jgi:hypothetical protein
MMKAKRRVQSYNIDDEIIERIRKDALARSMSNGDNISRSDIVNEILAAHYAVSPPNVEREEDPLSIPSSIPPSEQEDPSSENVSKLTSEPVSEPTSKYSFNLDDL